MPIKYSVGEIIKRERKRQGISQEKLSDGICTPSWLSKIESGVCTPTNSLFEMLMQRLGKNSSQYVLFQSEIEMTIESLKFRTRRLYSTNLMEESKKSYYELKSLIKDHNQYDQQFIALYDLLLFKSNELSQSELLSKFEEALNYSKPDFEYEHINDHLLTNDEIVIINNIAILMKQLERTQEAIKIMKSLKFYLENPRFDYDVKKRTYPLVMYNLSKWQGLDGDYCGCVSTCDIAIQYCVENGVLSTLASLLLNKGYAYTELGSKDFAIRFLRESYYINMATKEEPSAQRIREYALDKLGVDIAH